MSIEILHTPAPDGLVLDINDLYLIFGYGTGDTFNALIHLQTAPPARDYELIVKRPQLALIQFLLQLFERPPRRIHAVDYWQHDFAMQVATRFPTLPFGRGVAPHLNTTGLIDFWHNPFNYQKLLPLSDPAIATMAQRFGSTPPKMPLPPDSVVLFPTAGTNFSDYVPPWAALVQTLHSLGVEHVYVNQSGVAEYGSEDIEGALPLRLAHDELIRTFYASDARLRILAVRSGVLDILRFCGQRALVLYQPVPAGIFETCRFGLLSHNLDLIETICLKQSAAHQDAIVDYYLRHFLCSTLQR